MVVFACKMVYGGVWWCNHPSTCGGIGVAAPTDIDEGGARAGGWRVTCRWRWRVTCRVCVVCGGVGGTQPNFYLFITDFQYRDCQKHVSASTQTQ